ncbi:MAG: 2Fe-2S iron-sulfur cluster-binding protein [Acidobacteriota bacterium]|nr:2Fe-2S iron-sulfur cluster-binding protein [Acidobacteriota bacterium]MDQ7086412.1 2Fe-2S iron-sulfur cluster-binding protein [Acidobacteriota bacterium]
MSGTIEFFIDGRPVHGRPGQTILEAAEDNGVYIPRLCHMKGLTPFGGCRVCTCLVNSRAQAACTQPIAPGMIVDNDSEAVREIRRQIIEMLFVEGNHFCMFCEKSGSCELQALAYRFGITAPRHPYLFPRREVDATHDGVFIDHNRCVLCGRCVRASREVDGKAVFGFVGRGPERRVAVNAPGGLGASEAATTDAAMEACPVGAILVRGRAYATPIGRRPYDHKPIGSDVEEGGTP